MLLLLSEEKLTLQLNLQEVDMVATRFLCQAVRTMRGAIYTKGNSVTV